MIWNEATLKHSTNPLYLVILTLYLNSEHWYGITAAAPHSWLYYLTGGLESRKKNDISSNFLNHHNNSSERTRYNLGNTGGAWLLETRWVQHVLALEEQRHINQAVKELKAVYVRVYFQKNWQIGFKAAKAPNSLHAISPTRTPILCYPRSSCRLTLTRL